MTNDLNKDQTVSFNSLNLPQEMLINNATAKGKNYYIYTASGAKLQAIHWVDPTLQVQPVKGISNDAAYRNKDTTDYVGNKIYENGILNKILTDNGYIEGGIYYFYIKDHLGNNRIVANASGSVIQRNSYYPFGMSFGEETDLEQGKQNFKYNGKELDKTHGLNQYDYAARYMDPATVRFTSVDPLAEKYYSISPYVYVGNNPMNAIDPSGKLIIFINGMHAGSGGKSDYWGGFDKKVMEHLKDKNIIYFDGAMGGMTNAINNTMAKKRFGAGYYMGQKQASNIIGKVMKNRSINEKIKIISHSMGGAYAKGFVTALTEYFEKNEIDPSIIEFEADFAPYQPKEQKAVKGIITYQFSHEEDNVAGNDKIPGAKYMNTSSDEKQDHSITTFFKQISKLPAGHYIMVNGKLTRQE